MAVWTAFSNKSYELIAEKVPGNSYWCAKLLSVQDPCAIIISLKWTFSCKAPQDPILIIASTPYCINN